MDGKKILILYTSVGLGHKSLAENLDAVLQNAGFTIALADILKVQAVQSNKLIKTWQKFYLFCNQNLPWLWKWIYNSSNRGILSWLTLPLRVPLAGKNYRQLLELSRRLEPDLILSCESVASAAVSYLKKKNFYTGKFAIAFSDFHLHRYWLYPNCDLYLANTEEQKREMANLNINPDRIAVCGITLKPKLPIDIFATKVKLGVKLNQKVILVGVGSLGIRLNRDVIKRLTVLDGVKIFVVCGKNQRLFESLNREYGNNENIKVLAFYSPMDELYAIADLFVTKPGGLSTAEALRWHLPVVVAYWLPGGEDLNIEYLLKRRLIFARPKDLSVFARAEFQGSTLKKQLQMSLETRKIAQDGQAAASAVQRLLHNV